MDEPQVVKGGAGAMELDISSERPSEKIGVIKVAGEVDVYTSPRLRSVMLEHLDSGCSSVVVDLANVDYLDSSGLGILVAGLKRAKEKGGDVYLISPKPRIQRVLEITGLHRVFTILMSVDEAVKQAERK